MKNDSDEEGVIMNLCTEPNAGRGTVMAKTLITLLIAFSIGCATAPAHAVGPYFENESTGMGQHGGPNPSWPRPDKPLWSPSVPSLQSEEALKRYGRILRSSDEKQGLIRASKVQPQRPTHVLEAQVDKPTALR